MYACHHIMSKTIALGISLHQQKRFRTGALLGFLKEKKKKTPPKPLSGLGFRLGLGPNRPSPLLFLRNHFEFLILNDQGSSHLLQPLIRNG